MGRIKSKKFLILPDCLLLAFRASHPHNSCLAGSLIKWYCAIALFFSSAVLTVILASCSANNNAFQPTWKTYQNARYNFEFIYPSTWIASPPPANRDGQAFTSPLSPEVEIRGTASNLLNHLEIRRNKAMVKNAAKSINPNFTTQQGVKGELMVEIGSNISLMTLTFTQGQVHYNWQGRSPSEQFDDYYRFFYHIAEQYRITSVNSH